MPNAERIEVLPRNFGCQAIEMRGEMIGMSLGVPLDGTPWSPGYTKPKGALGYCVLWTPGSKTGIRPLVGLKAKNGSQRAPMLRVKFGLRRIVSCTKPAHDVPFTSLNSPAPCSNSLALPRRKSAKSTPVNWPLNEISGRASQSVPSNQYCFSTFTPATTMCLPCVQLTVSAIDTLWRLMALVFCARANSLQGPTVSKSIPGAVVGYSDTFTPKHAKQTGLLSLVLNPAWL